MIIKIVNIDKSNEIIIDDISLGYKCEFTCSLVSGVAVVVPYENREDFLEPGAILSVETSQNEITNFAIVSDSIEHSITRLSQGHNFYVVGTVSLNGDNEVFWVDVGNFTFILDIEDTKGIKPKLGDSVEFCLNGLILWDENT